MEEDILLDYIGTDEKINYRELPMIFGVSLDVILKTLNLTHIYDSDGLLTINDSNKNPVYTYDKIRDNQTWGVYNEDGKLIKNLHQNGHWEEYIYDTYGRFCGIESEKKSTRWTYDRFGKKIDERTVTDES